MPNKSDVLDTVWQFIKNRLIPDFTNKLTWYVVTLGGAILLTPSPVKLIIYNWLVDTFNINAGMYFTFAEVQSNSADYWVGLILILAALLHNGWHKHVVYSTKKSADLSQQHKRESDIKTFQKFIEIFPSDCASLLPLKEHDFENSFHYDSLKQIDNFIEMWNTAEYSFLDEMLEKEKKKLWSVCSEFANELALNSGPIAVSRRGAVIPDCHRNDFNIPKHVLDDIKKINELSTMCFEQHQNFVTLCRTTLHC